MHESLCRERASGARFGCAWALTAVVWLVAPTAYQIARNSRAKPQWRQIIFSANDFQAGLGVGRHPGHLTIATPILRIANGAGWRPQSGSVLGCATFLWMPEMPDSERRASASRSSARWGDRSVRSCEKIADRRNRLSHPPGIPGDSFTRSHRRGSEPSVAVRSDGPGESSTCAVAPLSCRAPTAVRKRALLSALLPPDRIEDPRFDSPFAKCLPPARQPDPGSAES
jgi:hypothetical protein